MSTKRRGGGERRETNHACQNRQSGAPLNIASNDCQSLQSCEGKLTSAPHRSVGERGVLTPATNPCGRDRGRLVSNCRSSCLSVSVGGGWGGLNQCVLADMRIARNQQTLCSAAFLFSTSFRRLHEGCAEQTLFLLNYVKQIKWVDNASYWIIP